MLGGFGLVVDKAWFAELHHLLLAYHRHRSSGSNKCNGGECDEMKHFKGCVATKEDKESRNIRDKID